MSSHMEDMETLRKSDFVRRFLVGAFKSEDEDLTFAETISLNVDTACYAVVIIAKPSDAEYELTAEKINRLFEGEVCGVARGLGVQDRLAVVAFAGDRQVLTDFLESKLAGLLQRRDHVGQRRAQRLPGGPEGLSGGGERF